MTLPAAVAACSADEYLVAARAPLPVALNGDAHVLRTVAKLHGVRMGRNARRTVSGIVAVLREHSCSSACEGVVALFRLVRTVPAHLGGASGNVGSFPPPPISDSDTANIVREWCAATSPLVLNEGACAICARMTAESELERLARCSVTFLRWTVQELE